MTQKLRLFQTNSAVLFYYILIGFCIFGTSFHNEFLLDDVQQIVENPNVHHLSHLASNFTGSTMASGGQISGIYYKPLMMISYALIWNIFGPSPLAFHIFQLLLHITNCFLIFLLFSQIFRTHRFRASISFFAGLLYLCHPMNAEAVLFAADLQEPLYSFFGLSALVVVAYFNSTRSLLIATIFLLASLLSKESGLQYIVAGIGFIALFRKERLKVFISFLAIVVAAYLILRLKVAGLNSVLAHDMRIAQADLLTRLATMPKVLMHYVHLFFAPIDISITQDWVVTKLYFQNFWLPVMEILAIASLILWQLYHYRSRVFLFFTLWFFTGWGLHSQLIPLDGTVSDRWFYFTMIGLIGLLFSFKFKSFRIPLKAYVVIGTMAILAFSYRTYLRSYDWRTPMTLFKKDLILNEDSFYLNNNVGLGYLAAGLYEESIPYFKKTIAVSPEKSAPWYVGWGNLGSAYYFLNQFTNAESALQTAIASGNIKNYRALAATYLELEEIENFENTIKAADLIYPNDAVIEKLKSVREARKAN